MVPSKFPGQCQSNEAPHCTQYLVDDQCPMGHAQSVALANADMAEQPDCKDSCPKLVISHFNPYLNAGGQQAIQVLLLPHPDVANVSQVAVTSDVLKERRILQVKRSMDDTPIAVHLSYVASGGHTLEFTVEDNSTGRTWVGLASFTVYPQGTPLEQMKEVYERKGKIVIEDSRGVQIDNHSAMDYHIVRSSGVDLRSSNTERSHGSQQIRFSVEIDLVEMRPSTGIDTPHPAPTTFGCLRNAGVRYLRLFSGEQWMLGRREMQGTAKADVMLSTLAAYFEQRVGSNQSPISAQHCLIKRQGVGEFELTDCGQNGTLLDGRMMLRATRRLTPGTRLAFTAQKPGAAELRVAVVMPHALIFTRTDADGSEEAWYLIAQDTSLAVAGSNEQSRLGTFARALRDLGLPLLCHAHGGFWHVDTNSWNATPIGTSIGTSVALTRLRGLEGSSWSAPAYPDLPEVTWGNWRHDSPVQPGISARIIN
jgi:hypothetical protein